ncbi:MAG TPA: hypothetical protein VFA34_07760 [Actinomycetota bacterium]|jgi:hypothetical protein|nr:hypothetical protein [Actinomycetota bacterium]
MKKTLIAAICITALAGACGEGTPATPQRVLPQGREAVDLNPSDFTTNIDNPYWPMAVGSKWVYRETDAEGSEQRVEVTVTGKTKMIANGVEARVVHDVVTQDAVPVEVTDDWYAQDSEGNIWYLGEATTSYENGKPTSTEGSFEAGKDGAHAGIVMPADPEPGMKYRQEYYKGHAEDRAEIVGLDETIEVPFGRFGNVLKTKDTNPLEPDLLEYKYYAKGIGPVLAETVRGGSDREELIGYTKG